MFSFNFEGLRVKCFINIDHCESLDQFTEEENMNSSIKPSYSLLLKALAESISEASIKQDMSPPST